MSRVWSNMVAVSVIQRRRPPTLEEEVRVLLPEEGSVIQMPGGSSTGRVSSVRESERRRIGGSMPFRFLLVDFRLLFRSPLLKFCGSSAPDLGVILLVAAAESGGRCFVKSGSCLLILWKSIPVVPLGVKMSAPEG